jgi:hypothetical protein
MAEESVVLKEPAGCLQWNSSARDSISASSDPKYLKKHTHTKKKPEKMAAVLALAVSKTSSICYPTIFINIHRLSTTAFTMQE